MAEIERDRIDGVLVTLESSTIPTCAACAKPTTLVDFFDEDGKLTPAAVYQDGRLWHPACWREIEAKWRAERQRRRRWS